MQARQAYILDISDVVAVSDVGGPTIHIKVNPRKRSGVDLVLLGPHALALRDRLNTLMPPPGLPQPGRTPTGRKHRVDRLSEPERSVRAAAAPGPLKVFEVLKAAPEGTWWRVRAISDQTGINEGMVRSHLHVLKKAGKAESRVSDERPEYAPQPFSEWRATPD